MEAFGAFLALKYEKVELKKSFDVFREKQINYTIKYLKNYKYVLVLVQDTKNPKASFETKNEPTHLNEAEANYDVKKAILASRVRYCIYREARLVSNMNKIYGIIWGQCTPGLQSVLKGNEEFPSR